MSEQPLWRSLQANLIAGEPVALATVVNQVGSAPQPEGASLLIRANGSLLGAVSAGCLESDVVAHGLQVLETGRPKLIRYDPAAADDPLAIGLTCGGSVELAIDHWRPEHLPILQPLFEALADDEEVVVVTSMDSDGGVAVRTAHGCNGTLPAAALAQLHRLELQPHPHGAGRLWPAQAWIHHTPQGDKTLWRQHRPATPLWIFGATDTANALAELARPLGFHSTIVDARSHFATAERCSSADAVVCRWPHLWFEEQQVKNTTVICVLNHDPKFEIPLLVHALRSPAAYVGALGSRATNRQRQQALHSAGLSNAELQRLRAPIGLALGGKGPAEIALSILAEVIMLRCGGEGSPLILGQGSLHRR